MKHGKKPTLAQKQLLRCLGLNPDNWLVLKNFPDKLEIIHRHSNKTRFVQKYFLEE